MEHEPPFFTQWIGENHFLVRSETIKDVHYSVDLKDNHCSCDDSMYRPVKTNCKHRIHVRAVIEAGQNLCDEVGIPFDPRSIGRSMR